MTHKKSAKTVTAELQNIIEKLDRTARDLKTLEHLNQHGSSETNAASGDELLQVARQVIAFWEMRDRFLPPDLIADPGWKVLLNLKIGELTHRRITISDACLVSGVPATTALRWIKYLTDANLIFREKDLHDGRRFFIKLTSNATSVLDDYLTLVRDFLKDPQSRQRPSFYR